MIFLFINNSSTILVLISFPNNFPFTLILFNSFKSSNILQVNEFLGITGLSSKYVQKLVKRLIKSEAVSSIFTTSL